MKRVMVVDDERPVVDGISLMVQRDLGQEFVVVGSAATGREALERSGELAPDIVLMDVSMPGISGLEAIRELRTRGSKAVFILVTAYERFDIAREAVELDLGDYLLKPVSRETLARSLRSAAETIDRRRDAELRLVEQREREEALRPFVERALLQGVMLGERGASELESALRFLSIGEPLALAAAIAYLPSQGLSDADAETAVLYGRLRETLRYRSRALVGTPLSRTSLVILPCKGESEARHLADDLRASLGKSLGTELARGVIRLGVGSPRPWASLHESWAEALAELSGLEGMHSRSAESDPPRLPYFEEDEDFIRDLLDGDESRASRSLGRILDACAGQEQVEAGAAGRIAALFGTVYRHLARRGLLSHAEIDQLLDLRDLVAGGAAGPWRFTVESRFARLHEVLMRQVRHSPSVSKALAYIRSNFQRPIGLEATAEWVGLSPNRLSRLLVEETGRGFSELLIDHRIEHAKQMLLKPGTSIKQVSLSSGYADPNYFARLFKKVTGLSPSSWAAGMMENDDE